jgi:hypothetical protein
VIRKPEGEERESKAHIAVGRAIETGHQVRVAGWKTAQVGGAGCFTLFLAMMAFGLIMSSTPWWFKAIGLIIFAGAFKLVRDRARAALRAKDYQGPWPLF